jgi:hypothetical protein
MEKIMFPETIEKYICNVISLTFDKTKNSSSIPKENQSEGSEILMFNLFEDPKKHFEKQPFFCTFFKKKIYILCKYFVPTKLKKLEIESIQEEVKNEGNEKEKEEIKPKVAEKPEKC